MITLEEIRERLRDGLYRVYERKLEAELKTWSRPKHIGIIMDGNRRFSKQRGIKRVVQGHRAGANKLEEVLAWCEEAEVDVVTVWIFSLENFKRSREEVSDLMGLFEEKFFDLVTTKRIHRDQIRIRTIGRTELLPAGVLEAIRAAEAATAHYQRRILNIGVAYGGREEIIDAFRAHLNEAETRGLGVGEIAAALEPADVERFLYTADLPDPDLIIRTSGEVRLSGFLLWQSAHSEYYFCDTYWPAFRKIDFLRALRSYHLRQRRFGK